MPSCFRVWGRYSLVGRMWRKLPANIAVIVAELPPVQNYFTREYMQMSRCCCGTRSHVQSASQKLGERGEVVAFAFAGSVSNPGKSERNKLIKLCWWRKKKFTLVCHKYWDTPWASSRIDFFSFRSQLTQSETSSVIRAKLTPPFPNLPLYLYALHSTSRPILLNDKEPKTNLFPNRVLMKHGQIYWS